MIANLVLCEFSRTSDHRWSHHNVRNISSLICSQLLLILLVAWLQPWKGTATKIMSSGLAMGISVFAWWDCCTLEAWIGGLERSYRSFLRIFGVLGGLCFHRLRKHPLNIRIGLCKPLCILSASFDKFLQVFCEELAEKQPWDCRVGIPQPNSTSLIGFKSDGAATIALRIFPLLSMLDMVT